MIRKSDVQIKVEKCLDCDEWVWMLLDEYNGVHRDGYAASKAEAMYKARQAREEELEWLNGD